MKTDTLKIDLRQGKMSGNLRDFIFQSDGKWIFYVPSLDMSSYADTPDEAEKFFFTVYLPEFFHSFKDDPKGGFQELEALGWDRNKILNKQFVSKSFIDRDGFLKDFDLPKDTFVEEKTLAIG